MGNTTALPRPKRDYGRTAFRQTFLYQMPAGDIKAFRNFGETIYYYGLEMDRYSPRPSIPHNRASLIAVLEDIEYLEEFLREEIDPPEESSSRELRLALVAEKVGQKLSEIAGELRLALRMRPRRNSEAVGGDKHV